ncbi:MAG: hypothetical protein ACOCUI_03840 [bacterium]
MKEADAKIFNTSAIILLILLPIVVSLAFLFPSRDMTLATMIFVILTVIFGLMSLFLNKEQGEW